MENLKKYVPYVLVLILLWTSIRTLNQVESLEEKLDRNRQEIGRVSDQMRSIQMNIQKDLDEDNLLESFDYEVDESSGELAMVRVDVVLNKFHKNSKVFISYEGASPDEKEYNTLVDVGVIDTDESQRIELVRNEQLIFTGQFKANKKLIYRPTLIVESDDLIETKRLSSIDLYYKFYPYVEIEIGPNRMDADGTISYRSQLQMFGNGEIDITSAICDLRYKNKIVDSFDIIVDSEAEIMNDGDVIMYDLDRTYQIELGSDEILSFEEITIEMKVETNEGITYTKKWDNSN